MTMLRSIHSAFVLSVFGCATAPADAPKIARCEPALGPFPASRSTIGASHFGHSGGGLADGLADRVGADQARPEIGEASLADR